jgi:ribosomal protein L17
MKHNRKGRELSRTASHRRALLRNLVTELFRHERRALVLTDAGRVA